MYLSPFPFPSEKVKQLPGIREVFINGKPV
jgi:hypothetical protein